MKELKTIITANRTNTTALKKVDFEDCAQDYKKWVDAVEQLRLVISDYAVADRLNKAPEEIQSLLDEVYEVYRYVLNFFTNKALGEKLKPQSSDIGAIRDVAGTFRKQAGSENGKDFLPVGAVTFRKAVEDFISDRLTARAVKTAEEIEAEKRAKAEAKKAAKKAKKQKEVKSKTAEATAA